MTAENLANGVRTNDMLFSFMIANPTATQVFVDWLAAETNELQEAMLTIKTDRPAEDLKSTYLSIRAKLSLLEELTSALKDVNHLLEKGIT